MMWADSFNNPRSALVARRSVTNGPSPHAPPAPFYPRRTLAGYAVRLAFSTASPVAASYVRRGLQHEYLGRHFGGASASQPSYQPVQQAFNDNRQQPVRAKSSYEQALQRQIAEQHKAAERREILRNHGPVIPRGID